jgi:RNA polymerase sigma-70 factor, ECF subfamily
MGGAALDATWALPAEPWEWRRGPRRPIAMHLEAGRSPVSETPEGLGEELGEFGLVAAARGGDRAAFGRLYQRYGRMVHGVLLARVPRSQVEDLVQDVFLLALRRLDSLRDVARFGGWLAMIARNRATDFHRRSRETVEFTDELAGPETSDEAEALAVLALLRGLPEAYRETMVLRLIEGMTGPEIAARTGMTEGSVRVNLHRGMKLLRATMGVESEDV